MQAYKECIFFKYLLCLLYYSVLYLSHMQAHIKNKVYLLKNDKINQLENHEYDLKYLNLLII